MATDILVQRSNPWIATRITLNALLRGAFVPKRLAAVYAHDLAPFTATGTDAEAAALLKGAEGQFRQVMILYGQILAQPEETAVLLLAEQFAALQTKPAEP